MLKEVLVPQQAEKLTYSVETGTRSQAKRAEEKLPYHSVTLGQIHSEYGIAREAKQSPERKQIALSVRSSQ